MTEKDVSGQQMEQGQEDAEEALVGPAAPPPAKKRKVLEHEAAYLKALPSAAMYERSYMHRDTITQVAVARSVDFIITGSVDGHIKFWKKQPKGVEFAKHYKAHLGPVADLVVSADSSLAASLSTDKTAKIFDVLNFDMIAMLRLPFVPSCAAWIFKLAMMRPCELQRGDAKAKLAVADAASGAVHVYDTRSGSNDAIATCNVHRAPVVAMRYNQAADCVVSVDAKGVIEYWTTDDFSPPAHAVDFIMKLETDLYCLAKAKAVPRSMEMSDDGSQFSIVSDDWRIRVFRFTTGKLRRTFDESADAANQLQRSEEDAAFRLDPIDFGRRIAVEKDLRNDEAAAAPNAVFDDSGNFLMYGTLFGIKVVNLVTNRCVRILGQVENTERFLRVALYQGSGATTKRQKLKLMQDASQAAEEDPTIVACAYRRQRVYLFSRREPADMDESGVGRDVLNEKPTDTDLALMDPAAARGALPRGAVIHTTRGDIVVKLFPDECPKTVENFTTHASNGYYDNVIFHRIIKGFMVQTGDPDGDGTGGASIWGGEFEDEFNRNLRHDRPFTLSMANAGPNTNGSQFFITTVPCTWLDMKHTVFGRVVKGADVVLNIEKVKTDKNDKPFDDIKIMNIEPKQSVD